MEREDKAFDAVQFWGTKGFFDSYMARPKDNLSPDDYKIWLSIFKDQTGNAWVIPSVNWDTTAQTVRITAITEIIQTMRNSDGKNFDPDSWLYQKRDGDSAVLRGEACMALYQLFRETKLAVDTFT
jgi:hypothetical protein